MYAMKVVSKKKSKDKYRTSLATELAAMREIPRSKFLAHCHSAFQSASDVFFVCDYISGGDLFYHLARRMEKGSWGTSEDESKILLAEVTLGLEHLHEHGFIHRDLKVENIMLDASGHVKLIDFGLACKIEESREQPMSPRGSLLYMAPELIKNRKGGRHTDWWAMGVLAFELLTGRAPWSSLSDANVIRREIQKCKVLPPEDLSALARQLVGSLLERNVSKRLGTARDRDVKEALFFSDIDWPATARGETAPAFVCGVAEIDPAEERSALVAYMMKERSELPPLPGSPMESAVPTSWSLSGVEVVIAHPKVAR